MNDLINKINLRFESGNSVPVDSVRITREEWDSLVAERDAALEREQALATKLDKSIAREASLEIDLGRYSMCAGSADHYRGEAMKARQVLGFEVNSKEISPYDIEMAIKRRDLIKQAEALEEEAKNSEYSLWAQRRMIESAADLRQRAQSLK